MVSGGEGGHLNTCPGGGGGWGLEGITDACPGEVVTHLPGKLLFCSTPRQACVLFHPPGGGRFLIHRGVWLNNGIVYYPRVLTWSCLSATKSSC